MEQRVARIQEAVEVTAAPPRAELRSNAQLAGDDPDPVERDLSDLPAFDPRDERPGHTGTRRQVRLAPVAALADGTNHAAEATVIHATAL